MFQPSAVSEGRRLYVYAPKRDRIKASPMFQFAFPAVLFQLRARGPQIRPLLQLPNRRATARGDVAFLPYLFSFYFLVQRSNSGGIVLKKQHTPQTPYAATPTGGFRSTASPMYQSADPAVPSQPRARGPHIRPSPQAPNRRATAVIVSCEVCL